MFTGGVMRRAPNHSLAQSCSERIPPTLFASGFRGCHHFQVEGLEITLSVEFC